ncbi:MAG: alpha/beta fold hydrolase [Nocardioidaceae bacterium]
MATADAPVLVLHAAGLDAGCARFLGLPEARALTLPGHHREGEVPAGLSLSDMVRAVRDHCEGPTHVVGFSLGGMVAQQLAIDHPDAVRSLVLSCTTAATDTAAMLARADATESASRETWTSETLERWFTAAALTADEPPAAVAYARACLESISPPTFAEVWRAIAGHDAGDRLREVEVPTTCIAGTYDVSTPPEVVAALAEQLPNSRLVQLDAPHMGFLESPAEFREAILAHLAWATADPPD